MALAEAVIAVAGVVVSALIIETVEYIGTYLHNCDIFTDSQPDSAEFAYDKKYILKEKDVLFVSQSKDVLREVLGDSPVDRILSLKSVDARMKVLKELTEKLSSLYGTEDTKIRIIYDASTDACGDYEKDKNRLTFNAAFLATDNPYLTGHFLVTVFHEFRHVVQWKTVCDYNDGTEYKWCNDETTANGFAEGFARYISYEENPLAYYNQFVEVDARNVSMAIMEGRNNV